MGALRRSVAFALAASFLASGCASMQAASAEERRFKTASLYHAFGAPLILHGVGGLLGGAALLIVASQDDSSIGYAPGAIVAISGLVVLGVGGVLVSLGNGLWAGVAEDSGDAYPESVGPTTPADEKLKACYALCTTTTWQVAKCQRECDEGRGPSTATSSAGQGEN